MNENYTKEEQDVIELLKKEAARVVPDENRFKNLLHALPEISRDTSGIPSPYSPKKKMLEWNTFFGVKSSLAKIPSRTSALFRYGAVGAFVVLIVLTVHSSSWLRADGDIAVELHDIEILAQAEMTDTEKYISDAYLSSTDYSEADISGAEDLSILLANENY